MTSPNVLCMLACLFGASSGFAQAPAFEIASIKPSSGGGLPMTIAPGLRNGTFHAQRATLRMVVAAAWGMTEPRILGPGWLNSSRFDIMAKSPQGVPDSALQPMLQNLLKDRFKLAAHLARQEMPVYFLEIAKGGVKMPLYPAHDGGPGGPGDKYRGANMIRGAGAISQIAQIMSGILGRPVLDRTGLRERYAWFLTFVPLSPQPGDQGIEIAQPDIFTAVQEQLGLKLTAGRDNVEIVVVDHIERIPTEN
jgi:uncharacterized protein (TIGR03435 family)